MNRRAFLKGIAATAIACGQGGPALSFGTDEYDGAPWVCDGVKGFYRFGDLSVTRDEFMQAMQDAGSRISFHGEVRAWPTPRKGLRIDTTEGGSIKVAALEVYGEDEFSLMGYKQSGGPAQSYEIDFTKSVFREGYDE
jgi:hypothetical protein